MIQAKNAIPRHSGTGKAASENKRHRFCIVDASVDEASYRVRGCWRGKHHHIRRPELDELQAADQIKPLVAELAEPKQPKPDYVFEWLIPWRALRRLRDIPTRGRSSKFGEYLSGEAAKGRPWASMLISEIGESKKRRKAKSAKVKKTSARRIG